MTTKRRLSIAAGVTPELNDNPARFVAAAAAAGWTATGVWHDPQSWTDRTATEVRQRLDDTGLTAVDMEVVRMGPKGDSGEALIDAAAHVGARNILAISSFADPAETAARFTALCERAAPAGIRVCIEFMRFTQVKNLSDALDIVARVDQPNAGILVDLLHVARSGTSFDEIAAVDPALFPYAQWCDAPTEPRGWDTKAIIADAVDDRSIPGDGSLHVSEFEQIFDATIPFSVEVRSKALRDTFPDPIERARHLLQRTNTALALTDR